MKRNMSQFDRAARTIIATVIVFTYLSGWIENKVLGIIALVIAGIFFLTALLGVCPVYSIFDIDTRSRKK